MKKTNSEWQDIQDVPVAQIIRVIRRDPHRVRKGLSFNELERLGSHRLWRPILDLPIPAGGDDVEPTIIDDRHERYNWDGGA